MLLVVILLFIILDVKLGRFKVVIICMIINKIVLIIVGYEIWFFVILSICMFFFIYLLLYNNVVF